MLYDRIANSLDDKITIAELDNFEIYEYMAALNEYIHIYWQQEENKSYKIRGKVIDTIYQEMKDWRVKNKSTIDNLLKHYIVNIYPKVFPKVEFDAMLDRAKECEYCHITLKEINELMDKKKLFKKHITRGWSLEIDRKAANLEYTKDNCVICCYWCNNAKTDEFSYDEFKKVGVEIEKIWRERLNS